MAAYLGSVKDYLSNVFSVFKETPSHIASQFGRKRSEVDEICNLNHVSNETLSKLFKVPKEEINNKIRRKYITKLNRNRRRCEEMVNDLFHHEYYENLYKVIMPVKFKKFMETIAFLTENMMSWYNYLMFTKNGRKMFLDVFEKPNKALALANLLVMLKSIWWLSSYDDGFFREEFFQFLPSVKHLFKGTPLESFLAKFIVDQITTKAFMTSLTALLERIPYQSSEKINLNIPSTSYSL